MTKEDIIAAMVILMNSYKDKAAGAEAIVRLWEKHHELKVEDGKILNKETGEEFK